MSNEVKLLRDAAALMRERSESAVESPGERWVVDSSPDHGLIVGSYTPEDVDVQGTRSTSCLAFLAYPGDDAQRTYGNAMPVAAHMASWDPAVALAVADWLDREARRVGSHAITTYKVREDWYAYSCVTCGYSGSTSKAGLATWQEHHASVRLVADDAAIAVARAYLGGAS